MGFFVKLNGLHYCCQSFVRHSVKWLCVRVYVVTEEILLNQIWYFSTQFCRSPLGGEHVQGLTASCCCRMHEKHIAVLIRIVFVLRLQEEVREVEQLFLYRLAETSRVRTVFSCMLLCFSLWVGFMSWTLILQVGWYLSSHELEENWREPITQFLGIQSIDTQLNSRVMNLRWDVLPDLSAQNVDVFPLDG